MHEMQPSLFETKRLRLRSLEDDDLNVFIAWWTDPLFLHDQTTDHLRQWTRESLLTQMKEWASQSVLFFVCEDKADSRIVAQCNLWESNKRFREYSYAIAVGRNYWNRGYGREITSHMVRIAFAELNAQRIALRVNADNLRAIRSYVAAGFETEGTLRHTFFRSGQWHDEIIMSRISDHRDHV